MCDTGRLLWYADTPTANASADSGSGSTCGLTAAIPQAAMELAESAYSTVEFTAMELAESAYSTVHC